MEWKLTSEVETWAEQLANDIMPIAREARHRLEYKRIRIEQGNRDIISGNAEEKKKVRAELSTRSGQATLLRKRFIKVAGAWQHCWTKCCNKCEIEEVSLRSLRISAISAFKTAISTQRSQRYAEAAEKSDIYKGEL